MREVASEKSTQTFLLLFMWVLRIAFEMNYRTVLYLFRGCVVFESFSLYLSKVSLVLRPQHYGNDIFNRNKRGNIKPDQYWNMLKFEFCFMGSTAQL